MTIRMISHAGNNGVIVVTSNASRRAGYCASVMIILMGIFGKFGAIFAAMPSTVLGRMQTFLLPLTGFFEGDNLIFETPFILSMLVSVLLNCMVSRERREDVAPAPLGSVLELCGSMRPPCPPARQA
ncbi:Uu.00g124330.m01.CDS01 [Anthostomella pinea]|uniref:Uu.00g124330.m01.CDS01 n=1 Tax=Anthostomella pinea TaxID=933095 RepID=A0AAI8YHK6_9PEZI|nr:Uu.00g124330.m01.CDS01 [Anthostomella pinea]